MEFIICKFSTILILFTNGCFVGIGVIEIIPQYVFVAINPSDVICNYSFCSNDSLLDLDSESNIIR